MEHMDGQLLEKQLKEEGCIEENRARELFRQLVEAVSYAHKQVCPSLKGKDRWWLHCKGACSSRVGLASKLSEVPMPDSPT